MTEKKGLPIFDFAMPVLRKKGHFETPFSIDPDGHFRLIKDIQTIRGDVKIPHSRMTKTCWETLVTCL